jgi:tetratricopeptide (TPR) repeat protein
MESQKLDPEKIGTPFQLLAAAMVFVVLLDGTLLSAAAVLEEVPGASMILVIAAVAYPPVLLGGLFVLQTRYRDKLLGDDAFLRMEEGANELRDSLRASGFDPTNLSGWAPTAGLSLTDQDEIRNRAMELERLLSASLKEDDGQLKAVADASRELGHAALAQAKWREGAEHLGDYLAFNPKAWSEWFAQGTAYANTREGAETDSLSIFAYTRALETMPEDVPASTKARIYTYRAGVLKRNPQNFDAAIAGLEKAREFAEEGSYEADDVHYNLAAILSMRGETDAAMHELRQIKDPWYFEAINGHIDDYFANLADRADFRHLLEASPPNTPPSAGDGAPQEPRRPAKQDRP